MQAAKRAMTKSAILNEIARNTGLRKKQVSSAFDELTTLIERHIKKGAVGQFALPGLMKIEVKREPATKARKGINPFTSAYSGESVHLFRTIPSTCSGDNRPGVPEETVFKASPARNVANIRPLKKVKDIVG
jgi:nucleoid DNA-binding protein